MDIRRQPPSTARVYYAVAVQKSNDYIDRLFQRGDASVRDHYQMARSCLVGCLGDPACDLMLMLVLTVAASTATPQVAPNEHAFSAAPKHRDPAILAATMVTRML